MASIDFQTIIKSRFVKIKRRSTKFFRRSAKMKRRKRFSE